MTDEVAFEPSDTFDILTRRTKSLRAKRDQVAWSSISLEMHGVPIKPSRSYGEARIDESLFRNLSGGEPTSFRVEPGMHTVTVHLSRWLRLPYYRRSSKLSIQVAVQPGEQVKLVCGLRPGAKEEWTTIRIARFRSILILWAGSLLAVVFGWFLCSLLGRMLAPAAILIVIRGARIPPIAVGFVLRMTVMAPIFLVWWSMAKRLIVVPNRRVLQSLRYRFVYPYSLKNSEEPFDGRQPAF